MDLWNLSIPQISVCTVYFLPCILDPYHTDAGMLLLLCEKESTWANEDLCIEKMKAFAEYIASAMYFAEAFLNADKHSPASSARSGLRMSALQKAIDKYPMRVYSIKCKNTHEGYMTKMQIPLN